ncbi:MAG TPA: NUDIX hydrolase [Bacteroidia bacterium]|jgi:nudix-type nucleoside diphosphatase (YffH/AdpP family)|nr:NUDIX hydrolase [Bacteroidia bacterium]
MALQLPILLNEEIVFDRKLTLTEGNLQGRTHKGIPFVYSRLKLNRQDAAAVLIFNTESRKIILTRQYRYAIASRTPEPILEIMAGKVDPGEEPVETGIRESLEECGYRIGKENIHHLASFFASPGYTSEKYHLYYATVCNADRITAGGGLEEEHENIEVVEMDPARFWKMAEQGLLEDGKTLTAALLVKSKGLSTF